MSAITLSPPQQATLRALCDTLFPSLPRAEDPHGFWRRSGSEMALDQHLRTVIALQGPAQQADFSRLLDLFGSPMAGLAVGGPLRPLSALSPAEREALLQRWASSRLPLLRQGFQALKRATLFLAYALVEEGAASNPNWPAIGYPGPLRPPPAQERPLRPLALHQQTTLECDVVIVGSGAGGGVVAGQLAEAGLDVIVLEKGPYVAEDGFTQREAEMLATLYEAGGTLATNDLSMAVLAGSCLGGGTTVNWAGSFRTPPYVLEEWAREHLLPHLLTPDYQASFAAVEAATDVDCDESPRNPQNQALWEGAERRGAEVRPIPRNVRGCDFQSCGYCGLGCQTGAKQSTLRSYLQRAHEAGARLLVNTEVRRVTVAQGRATGVQALHRTADGTHHAVQIRARRVVVAAGAIHTPALLRRSGLSHPHIGQHLFLHPTVGVSALYERAMNPWWGVMMAAVCDEWAQLDGAHGVKIETPPVHPGLSAIALPWRSGAQHKAEMAEAARTGHFIVICRDRDGGHVSVDRRGQPVLHYRLSAYDRRHLLRGTVEAARLHAAAGAEALFLPHGEHHHFPLTGSASALEQQLADVPNWRWEPNRFSLFSAHQMGSCRMGGDAQRHPLTPECETREVRGLYVTDASAFPAASGANPMLSIQALAHFAARGLADALG